MKHLFSILVALCSASFSFAQQIPLDSTFSNDGIDILTFDTTVNFPEIAILPDGRSVIGLSMILPGNSFLSPILVRYTQNGTVDSTFGINGVVKYETIMTGGFSQLKHLPSGKFLFRTGAGNGIGLFRIESNGKIDSTFGINGVIIFSSTQNGGFSGISHHILNDNKILVTREYVNPQDSSRNLLLTRYTHEGQIDSSYANNGTSTIPLPIPISQEVFLLPNDDVLFSIAGYNATSTSKFLKVKVNGELDNSFANNMPISPAMLTHGCVVLPDGKFLFTGRPGYGTPKRMIMRLNADGTLDNTFNGTGYIIMPNNSNANPQFFIYGAYLTPDNRIITGYIGYENYQNQRHMGVSMIRTNGTFETSFGINGTLIVNFPTGLDKISGLAYDRSAGKAMLVGTGMDSTQNYIEILLTARINVPAAPSCVTVYSTQNVSICPGTSYTFNGQIITQAGLYTDTLQSATTCDSIINLNVTVLPLPTQTQNILLCPGESTTINGISYSQNAIVIDTVNASTGCDTIKTYYINTIPASEIDTFNFYKCEGDTLLYKGNVFTTSGAYQDTMTSVNGCDSIERITFVFFAPPQALFSITPDAFTPHNWYAVNQSTGDSPLSYTWYWGDGSSDTGSAASHTYTSEGYYNICLEVTTNMGCSDIYCDSSTYIFKAESTITINVVNALPTGINEAQQIELSIMPNPTSGIVKLSTSTAITNYSLTDNLGRTLLTKPINGILNEQLDMGNYSNGVYLLRLSDSHGNSVTKRVLKQ